MEEINELIQILTETLQRLKKANAESQQNREKHKELMDMLTDISKKINEIHKGIIGG